MRPRPLIVAACLLALAAAAPASAADWAGRPATVGGLTAPAVTGAQRLELATARGFQGRFWPGVNLGATVPGRHPGELAATRRDYDHSLRGMGALGVRVVRVYTIQNPVFYDALAAYNRAHPKAPLRLIQGVWIPEDSLAASGDLYAPAVVAGFEREIADAVAAVHGDATIPALPGHARGRYRSDVSRWLLAWSPGVEWDPTVVRDTDRAHAGLAPYAGRYFTASAEATPTESWITARLDHLAGLEAARGWTRPVTFTNWLTLDPLAHPTDPAEDFATVDAMHVRATAAWPGGFFASYHAYPYYPDWMAWEPAYAGASNPYAAYLRELRAHHGGQVVMITEFGVPTGVGTAHPGLQGWGQGDHSETRAGAIDAAMLRTIQEQGYAGAVVFEWIDEWFKRSWNTMDYEQPAERRAVWRNVLNNEEQFGLVAAEAGTRSGPVLDGRDRDWRHTGRVLLRNAGGLRELRAAHDEAYLHLLLRRRSAKGPIQLGFDLRPGGNRGLPGRPGVAPGAEVAITLAPGRDGKLEQAAWVDPVSVRNREQTRLSAADVAPGSGVWVTPRLVVQRESAHPDTGERHPFRTVDVGRLRRGSSPAAGGGDDRVLVADRGTTVELRIPWALLTVADPSSRRLWQLAGGAAPTTRRASAVGITAAPAGRPAAAARRYGWRGWNRVRWHERRKAGWAAVRREMLRSAAR
jgi:hypothetical protein